MKRAKSCGDQSRQIGTKNQKRDVDVKETRPELKDDTTFILFDLQTTGLDRPRHITQIAALILSTDDSFDCFVLPKKPMEKEAQDRTGIRVTRSMHMKFHEKKVKSISITKAIKRFLKWMKRFPNVVLVAHYGRLFDFEILLAAARYTGFSEGLDECVHGYIDSWEMFRSLHRGLSSYKQEDLVKYFTGETYTEHDSTQHVTSLKQLIIKEVSSETLLNFKFLKSDIEIGL